MAKKKTESPAQNSPAKHTSVSNEPATIPLPKEEKSFLFGDGLLGTLKVQALIVALIALLCYGNSIANEYAVDDLLVIERNDYVHEGIKGIPKLLTQDSYQGFSDFRGKQLLAGGRWRPLSMVTFAIDYQLWQDNTTLSHAVNILLYVLSCVVLLGLLRRFMLPKIPDAAFIAALIFAFHPIHTEVVANIKSRDEILSLLFLLLTLWFSFKAIYGGGFKSSLYALGSFFLALLAKENGVMFLFLFPLTLYTFTNLNRQQIIRYSLPIVGVIFVYLLMRGSVTGWKVTGGNQDILNAPYVRAVGLEKLGTIFLVLGTYIKLLFFPYPLSWDYSFNQIPYVTFSDWRALLSLVLHVGLGVWALLNIKSKNILAYAILFYLASIVLISNIVVNLGAFMGERLVYQASVGFALALAVLFSHFLAIQQLPDLIKRMTVLGVLIVLAGLSFVWCVKRNAIWKNNDTLYLHDVNISPNSVKTNLSASQRLTKSLKDGKADTPDEVALVWKAIGYSTKAITIHPTFTDAYIDRGISYLMLDSLERAEQDFMEAYRQYPTKGMLPQCFAALAQSYLEKSNKARDIGKMDSAEYYLNRVVRVMPNHHSAIHNLGIIAAMKGDMQRSIALMRQSVELFPSSASYWYDLAVTYLQAKQYPEAKQAALKAIQIDPNYAPAQKIVADLQKY